MKPLKLVTNAGVAPELAEEGVAPKREEELGIPIKGIPHVGVCISDLKRSVKFYEMLGFAKEKDRGLNKDAPVIMRHDSGVAINLSSQEDPNQNHLPITLEVDSLTKTRNFLRHNDINIADSYEDDTYQVVCVKDPDNNVIELNHYQ